MSPQPSLTAGMKNAYLLHVPHNLLLELVLNERPNFLHSDFLFLLLFSNLMSQSLNLRRSVLLLKVTISLDCFISCM